MRRLLLIAALFGQALALSLPAAAEEPKAHKGQWQTLNATWQIVQSAGEVSVSGAGFLAAAFDRTATLPEGAIVKTGATGRVILRRGGEQITVAPMSSIVLSNDANFMTRVRQETGSALFKITKGRAPHFAVDTPFLAATVKGTTFTVKVDGSSAEVHVTEGAVEVANLERTAVTLIKPGMTAVVDQRRDGEIKLMRDGLVTDRVTRDNGGWSAPSAPGGGSDSGSTGAGGANGGSGGATGLTTASNGALLRSSSGATDAAAPAPQNGASNSGSAGAGMRSSNEGAATQAASDGQPSAANAGLTDARSNGGVVAEVGVMTATAPSGSKSLIVSQSGSKEKQNVSAGRIDSSARNISNTAVTVSGAGDVANTVRHVARPRHQSTSGADLPLRDIALCALGLVLYMVGSQMFGAKRRTNSVRIRRD